MKQTIKKPTLEEYEEAKNNIEFYSEWVGRSRNKQAELIDAVEHSKTQVKIPLTGANLVQRRAAVQFQRSFEKLDNDTAAAIIELLNKEDN